MKTSLSKPPWLNKRINLKECEEIHKLTTHLSLNTVCQQAACPNISECFKNKHATFLILGKVCTRSCEFCNVSGGVPQKLDMSEPKRVAQAAQAMGLKHVVITSVTRDDLKDGGSSVFVDTVLNIRQILPQAKIELLIPDFKADLDALDKVVQAKPDIIGHNLETVLRLHSEVRKQADYRRSLEVLSHIKRLNKDVYSKSALLLGMGEKEGEVIQALKDLRKVQCDFLSLGQYLSPSKNHFPVKEFIAPEMFENYKHKAQKLGFEHVESAPYVRSSYSASEYLN